MRLFQLHRLLAPAGDSGGGGGPRSIDDPDREVFVDGLRARHGNASNFGVGPVVEVPPPDELKPGVPAAAPPAVASGPDKRRKNGQFTSAGAAEAARAKAEKERMRKAWASAVSRPLRVAPDSPLFKVKGHAEQHMKEAEAWLSAEVQLMARDVGDGRCGPGPFGILRTAAFQFGQSWLLFELASGAFHLDPRSKGMGSAKVNVELLQAASRLGDSARQNVLAAYHMCRLEAVARRERDRQEGRQVDPLAAYLLPPNSPEGEDQ